MARIVRHENGRVLEVIEDAQGADWTGRADALVDPDESPVIGLPVEQWRVDAGALRPSTPAELAATVASLDQVRKDRLRTRALDRFDAADSIVERAVVVALMDEINNVRVAVSLAPITKVQMRTRIRARITAGDAD